MPSLLRRNRRSTAYQLQREFTKFLREQEKMQEQQRAIREVELFESYLDMLQSVHLDVDAPIDWEALKHSRPPFAEGQKGPHELEAEHRMSAYRPSLWDRLFRRAESKRDALQQRVMEARAKDHEEYREWEISSRLAERITDGDRQAYLEAVTLMKPFDDLAEWGSNFTYQLTEDSDTLDVEFQVHSNKVIPQEVKKLTKTGKLSISQMPTTRYYELEQDYVCSCILRIARDLFALLPLNHIYVHAVDIRMNPAVGRMEQTNLVSVRIERLVLESLNLDAIDPSDAMTNFEHRMKFLKTKGFQPIDRLGA